MARTDVSTHASAPADAFRAFSQDHGHDLFEVMERVTAALDVLHAGDINVDEGRGLTLSYLLGGVQRRLKQLAEELPGDIGELVAKLEGASHV